jgi:hypothetical protein
VKFARVFMLVRLPEDFSGDFDAMLRHIVDLPNPTSVSSFDQSDETMKRSTHALHEVVVAEWPRFMAALAEGRSLVATAAVQTEVCGEWIQERGALVPKVRAEP